MNKEQSEKYEERIDNIKEIVNEIKIAGRNISTYSGEYENKVSIITNCYKLEKKIDLLLNFIINSIKGEDENMETIDELKALKEEYKNIFAELDAKLDNKIAELEKSEQQKSRRWKPEMDDEYYLINGVSTISREEWNNDTYDLKAYSIGNMFKTREKAEFAIEQLKILAELKEYTDDDKEWNDDNNHWCIQYDTNRVCINADYYSYVKNIPFNIYFSSEEQAQRAIDAIGEERLIKYYFEIKEE